MQQNTGGSFVHDHWDVQALFFYGTKCKCNFLLFDVFHLWSIVRSIPNQGFILELHQDDRSVVGSVLALESRHRQEMDLMVKL